MHTPTWRTYIALAGDGEDDEDVITDPPARVLEVVVIAGDALCTLRTVDEHESISEPVASFDIDAQTLIGVLQAGLMSSPRRDSHT